MSRSTWACELKSHWYTSTCFLFCHAPRERVSWNLWIRTFWDMQSGHAPRERVSWNVFPTVAPCTLLGHAPRERVSWNDTATVNSYNFVLSRSTWACELKYLIVTNVYQFQWRSRSTWACELKFPVTNSQKFITWSRSTWACELKFQAIHSTLLSSSSRSTWACELKLKKLCEICILLCHAPRERVSWNDKEFEWKPTTSCHAPRERVSWNRDHLTISDSPSGHAPRERVSWNSKNWIFKNIATCHAPRERVSWNGLWMITCGKRGKVTLHVSVWVEISLQRCSIPLNTVTLHVSVWVEICYSILFLFQLSRHAPRERVSWNVLCRGYLPPVSKSRSTWACELK